MCGPYCTAMLSAINHVCVYRSHGITASLCSINETLMFVGTRSSIASDMVETNERTQDISGHMVPPNATHSSMGLDILMFNYTRTLLDNSPTSRSTQTLLRNNYSSFCSPDCLSFLSSYGRVSGVQDSCVTGDIMV